MKADIISMLATVLLAAGIVIAGYQGITYVGKEILKSDTDISMVDEDKKLKYMFYSETDEQIQVFPWNYENQENVEEIDGDVYKFIKNSGTIYNLRELTMNYICKQIDLSEKEYKALYKELKPQKKNFKQVQVSIYEQSYTLFYYSKEVKVKEEKDYSVKYVLGEEGSSLIAFCCQQLKQEGLEENQLKEEQIIEKLNKQAVQIERIIVFMKEWNFKYSWEIEDTDFFNYMQMLFLGVDDHIAKEYNVEKFHEEKKKLEGNQAYGTDYEGMAIENSLEEKNAEQKLSEYQILVLSDKILVIIEEERVILQYSRDNCELMGFSLN